MSNGDVRYGFAVSTDGELMDASTAPKGKDALYYCIHCRVAMGCYRGEKNAAHFRHREPTNCNPHIYLRKLAKIRLLEWYNNSPEIPLSYQNIHTKQTEYYNLKAFYDKAVFSAEELEDPNIPKADIYLLRRKDDEYTSLKPLLIRIFTIGISDAILDFKSIDCIVSSEDSIHQITTHGFCDYLKTIELHNLKNYKQ